MDADTAASDIDDLTYLAPSRAAKALGMTLPELRRLILEGRGAEVPAPEPLSP